MILAIGIFLVACTVGASWLSVGSTNSKMSDEQSTYRDSYRAFSFVVPAGYQAFAMAEEGGEVVLIRNAEGETVGQLYVSDVPDIVPLTPEFVSQELSGTRLFDLAPYVIAKRPEIQAVAFSFEPTQGRTSSEVWFSHANVLYQWSISTGFEDSMLAIISSLQW